MRKKTNQKEFTKRDKKHDRGDKGIMLQERHWGKYRWVKRWKESVRTYEHKKE